ncbi:MAG: Crp/Fnr family transcriptional regulator [Eubacteriales bacterium]
MGRAMFESVFREKFPFWQELSEDDKIYLCNNTYAIGYPRGTVIHDGSHCPGVILVQKGCLRVYLLSEKGKEVTLYRLYPGDICILSAPCVLDAVTFDVLVEADEFCECYVIGGQAFRDACEKNPHIKIFALETTVSRFSDVMWVMQQILFMSMDRRLAIFLSDESARTASDTVALTHEQIAKYMGSAREVVTRMLKYFAAEGIVELSRKGVKILDKQRLRQLTL